MQDFLILTAFFTIYPNVSAQKPRFLHCNSADIVKALALGADAVYIATSALLALGCHLCRTAVGRIVPISFDIYCNGDKNMIYF